MQDLAFCRCTIARCYWEYPHVQPAIVYADNRASIAMMRNQAIVDTQFTSTYNIASSDPDVVYILLQKELG